MLGDALYLARKDTRYLFRSPGTWLWTFVMPLVFFYFIGTVTGGYSDSSPAEPDRIGLLVADDADLLADQLGRRLEGLGYQVDRVSYDTLPYYSRQLRIPPGFTKTVLGGEQAEVEWTRRGAGLSADYDGIRIQRAVYAVLADLIVIGRDGGEPTGEAFERLAAEERSLTLAVTPAGAREDPPGGFEQAVPGTMVMFVMLVMFTTGGVSLNQERSQGILRRLASAPMSRGAVVLGKWASRMFVGIIQIAFAMIVGVVLFGLDWGRNLPTIILLLLAYASLAACGGILLGNFCRNEGQTAGIGVILTNVMGALGGCWWPIEVTPLWAQRFAIALPTGWMMDALHKLVSFGASPATVVPHFIALASSAILAGWIVSKSLRFELRG